MSLFLDLLARGYFPIQLPPGFTTASLAAKQAAIEEKWKQAGAKFVNTLAERFSVPRSSYYRRSTAILNPVGFYFLAQEISAHWSKIEAFYLSSAVSKSIPAENGTLRAIQLTKFSELHEDKITASSGFKFALITDISSFFPTIYTHTIPWALHGKVVSKTLKGQYISGHFGTLLDKYSMGVQDGQTIGLPIGPDTSHILAEIIGVAIDLELKKLLNSWPAGFRYVDDFYFFFNSREQAERALASIVRAVGDFELQINPAKTRIVEVREISEESWKFSVKKLRLHSKKRTQRDDIHRFFESLFSLERRYKDESIVKYGLKQVSSTIVKKSNWALFEAYLLKCGYAFPNTIQILAHLLATYQHHGYSLNKEAIGRFCNTSVASAAASDHHGEVAWLLWICKELAIPIDSRASDEVVAMKSPACTLLLLDLHDTGLAGPIDPGLLSPHAETEALLTSSWLLAYEAGRRKWLKNSSLAFIKASPHFRAFLQVGVGFYDTTARLGPIFKFKGEKPPGFDFDSDCDIDEDFEFDEVDEEYFDSDDEGEEEENEEEDDENKNGGDDEFV